MMRVFPVSAQIYRAPVACCRGGRGRCGDALDIRDLMIKGSPPGRWGPGGACRGDDHPIATGPTSASILDL
jgi:hypothetical protein